MRHINMWIYNNKKLINLYYLTTWLICESDAWLEEIGKVLKKSEFPFDSAGQNRRCIVASCIPFCRRPFILVSFLRACTHARTHAGTRGLDSLVLLLTRCPIKDIAKRVRLPACVLPSGRARITSTASRGEHNRDRESVDIVKSRAARVRARIT